MSDATQLQKLEDELESINMMLDDFSTDMLIQWSPKIDEIENKIKELRARVA